MSGRHPRRAAAGPVPGGSRERLVEAAMRLLRQRGYEATVVKDIAREGDAPMGSFYYHFPLGKEQLAAAAVRLGGDEVARLYLRALQSHTDPGDALAAIPLRIANMMERSAWRDGCPVATTALETVGRVPSLQQAAAEAFDQWQEVVAGWLRRAGCDPDVARDLALTTLTIVEGAELLARVRRSREPLERAAATLRQLAREAIRLPQPAG